MGLVEVVPGCLLDEVFWICSTRRRPWSHPGHAGDITSRAWFPCFTLRRGEGGVWGEGGQGVSALTTPPTMEKYI